MTAMALDEAVREATTLALSHLHAKPNLQEVLLAVGGAGAPVSVRQIALGTGISSTTVARHLQALMGWSLIGARLCPRGSLNRNVTRYSLSPLGRLVTNHLNQEEAQNG